MGRDEPAVPGQPCMYALCRHVSIFSSVTNNFTLKKTVFSASKLNFRISDVMAAASKPTHPGLETCRIHAGGLSDVCLNR